MSETKIPAVGQYVRGLGTLVRVENVFPPPQPPPQLDYIFEEITARPELRMGTETVKAFDTTWDFKGNGESVKEVVETAKLMAARMKLGPGSELEMVAVKFVQLSRKRPDHRENFYDRSFRSFEKLPVGSTARLPNPAETVVWSSKNPTA